MHINSKMLLYGYNKMLKNTFKLVTGSLCVELKKLDKK